jgi:CheY-like chemotaxis protein
MNALHKILVVDDDPVVGKSFDRVLSKKGYAVITARSGEEALNKLRSEDYDLMFTDIKMPGMDGLEVAEKAKAGRPWMPVVIITGYGTVENETRAKAAGVSEFLHKPLSPDTIERSARTALKTALPAPISEPAPVGLPARKGTALKNIALFLAGPFIALAYVIALPIVGLGMLAWMGAGAAAKYPLVKSVGLFAKHLGMLIAAPLVGLAFIVVAPFAGLAMLAWIAARKLLKG